jgi:hypothetical protein
MNDMVVCLTAAIDHATTDLKQQFDHMLQTFNLFRER